MALQVIFLDQVASTNQYLKTWSEEHPSVEEVAVFARHQTQGKGQRGRHWESNKGDNVLGSFLIRDCMASQLVGLNIAAALAVVDLLMQYTQHPVYVKWPNDVYVQHQKIAGVLLENTIQADRKVKVIAGLGININQRVFKESKATSLHLLTNITFEVRELCLELADYFYKRVKLSQRQLLNDVNSILYKKGEDVTFGDSSGNRDYTIQSILYSGKLKVLDGAIEKELDHNYIKWIE